MRSIIFAITACLLCLGVVMSTALGQQRFPFQTLLGKSFLSAHDLTEDSFHELLMAETHGVSHSVVHGTDAHHYLSCGPLAELKAMRTALLQTDSALSEDHVRTVYQSRVRNMGCLLLHSKRSALEKAGVRAFGAETHSGWTFVSIPAFMKVRSSVFEHLTVPASLGGSKRSSMPSKRSSISSGPKVQRSHLQVELSLGSASSQAARRVADGMVATLKAMESKVASRVPMTKGWQKMVSALRAEKAACAVHKSMIKVHSSHVVIDDIHMLSDSCLATVVEVLAAHPAVLTLRVAQTPGVVNYDGGAVEQTGATGSRPYTEAGLTGKDQICAVMDTGLDDMSCFFADDACSTDHSNCLTPRDGQVYPDRSKVIQYIPYADETDYEGGHGSHVTGSVLGSGHVIETYNADPIINGLEDFNGIAMDAKVAFQDIGDQYGELGVLNTLSLYSEAFPAAYAAGARVHTNSWGGSSSYDSFAGDVDRYTYENPDFLVLVAAGNGGNIYNYPSVGTPGIAKNALTVGSGQMRDNFNDEDFSDSTLSYFSSTGPTEEGRIKPDVVSPGSFISSARAADPMHYEYAKEFSYWQFTCTTHSMSGTSMATPLTAGTALLVRQYFEDPDFWAARCDTDYSTCVNGAFSPSGYLLKATIMHSGQPMARYAAPSDALPVILGETPDVFQGYGYVTLSNVLPLEGLEQNWNLIVHDDVSIAENEVISWRVSMRDDGAPLRVTIAWYDVYAELNGNLIHNLDLKITSPNGTVYFGNNNAFGGDEVNPNEQVTIDKTGCSISSCVYVVEVVGVSITMADKQKFAVVMTTTGSVEEHSSPAVSSLPFSFESLKYRTHSFAETITKPGSTQADTIANAAAAVDFFSSVVAINTASPSKAPASSPNPPPSRSPTVHASTDIGQTSYDVDVGSFTLEGANNFIFNKTFSVASNQDLSTVLFEFSNWADTSTCPFFTFVTITDPTGKQAVVWEWPWGFASCLFGGYTLGRYSHLAMFAGEGLRGAGEWSVSFEWMVPGNYSVDYDVSLTLTMNTPNVEYKVVSKSFDIVLSEDDEIAIPLDVSISEWNSGCYQLSHVKTVLDFAYDNCNYPADLLLAVSDGSSRSVGLLSLLQTSWYTYDGGIYTGTDLVDSAALSNEGTYTINVALGPEGCNGFSESVELNLYFRQSECPASSDLEFKEIPFGVTLSSCYVLVPSWVGDGYCDHDTMFGSYNSPGCNYDGGDCCEESCVPGDLACGSNGYECVDPEYACTVPYPSYLGDGWCDGGEYNSGKCGYDGGDCCAESCDPDAQYTCGIGGYDCVDPEYDGVYSGFYRYEDEGVAAANYFSFDFDCSFPDVSWTDFSIPDFPFSFPVSVPPSSSSSSSSGEYAYSSESSCVVPNPEYVGDGWCDDEGAYNTAACGYDGGDCCVESCHPDAEYACGVAGYNCVDPEYAGTFSDVYSTSSSGYSYTSAEYDYSGELYSDDSFSLNPSPDDCDAADPGAVGNGFCDSVVNTAACNWDNGDCCELSCVDGEYECGYNGFNCRDPAYAGKDDDSVYSQDYSFFTSAIAIIDQFEQEGYLDSVKLTLDTSTLPTSVLGYLLAVVVVDPFDRLVQIGGYGKAAYEVNSVIMNWPQNWLSYESNSLVGVRDVAAAGLSSFPPSEAERRKLLEARKQLPLRSGIQYKFGRKSDFANLQPQRVTVAEDDDDSGVSLQWSVILLFGYDYVFLPEQDYKGIVKLEFVGASPTHVPTFNPSHQPTKEPTVKPTVQPSSRPPTPSPSRKPTIRPSRAPTRRPTLQPTKKNTGTFITFNTTIELDLVGCAEFIIDLIAQESCRLSTLLSLNENLEEDEVLPGIVEACFSDRRTLGATVSHVTVKRGLVTGLLVEYTTVANIENLGMSSASAAYDSMVTSLSNSISTGQYTELVRDMGSSMNTSTLATVMVTQTPKFSNYTVMEVVPSSNDGSSSKNEDDVGAIAGGVVGGVVLLSIVIGVVYFFHFRSSAAAEDIYNEKANVSSPTRASISPNDVSKRGSIQGSGAKEMDEGENVSFGNPIFAASAPEPTTTTSSSGKNINEFGGL